MKLAGRTPSEDAQEKIVLPAPAFGRRGPHEEGHLRNRGFGVIHRNTNEAFIADGYGSRRVIVLDADTGAFKRMWGAFGIDGRLATHAVTGRRGQV